MTTSTKCRANDPANCNDPQCPEKRAQMADFFNGAVPAAPTSKKAKVKAPAAPRTSHEELSEMMDLGRVIQVAPNGAFPALNGLGLSKAPEEVQYVDLDADGGAPDPVAPAGWEYLKGFTGQYGYSGSVMHSSEYMGGRIADHILDNPGFYAVVEIDVWPEDESTDAEPVGWGVLHYVGEGA